MLRIISTEKTDEITKNIHDNYLTTPQREHMYRLFTGDNSLKFISEQVGTSTEAVRQFAVLLDQAGIINYVQLDSRSKAPKRKY